MLINNAKSPGAKSTTGVKYLNVDKRYMLIARVCIRGKHFVVWKGTDKTVGTKVAKKIQDLMAVSEGAFLDWYDYEKDDWLENIRKGER